MECLAGFDGGATSTVCVLADRSGRVLAWGKSGPANYLQDGVHTARASLRQSLHRALKRGGVKASSIGAVCAGLAGARRPKDRAIMARVLKEVVACRHLVVESDAYVALVGATGGKAGVIQIAGTGSISLGVGRSGSRARAGGWGALLGDQGSAYQVARRALSAVLCGSDGRGPKTRIAGKVTEALYLSDIQEILSLLYGGQLGHASLAALYPLVVEAAEEGDRVAAQLLEDAAEDLFSMTRAVFRRLGPDLDGCPVALSGGAFVRNGLLKQAFEKRLASEMPGVPLIEAQMSPEMGAVLVARAAWEGRPVFRSN